VKKTILVADDEADVLKLVTLNLTNAGFAVTDAEDGSIALTKARELQPSLIVLDVMMPKLNGIEVCKMLKRDSATRNIPIVLISAKAGEIDRVVGFEVGADDYITKPFSPRELVLRVQSILRRAVAPRKTQSVLEAGSITMDLDRHDVTVSGHPVELTAIEFKLLRILMDNSERVQSRDSILSEIWGYDRLVEARTVDTHMRRLREKLGDSARHIETIRSFGYRFNSSAA